MPSRKRPPESEATLALNQESVRRSLDKHEPGQPGLLVLAGADIGTVFYFDESGKTIGRDPETGICLKDELVSRRHAQVYQERAEQSDAIHYVVVDLHSRNGTVVNEERVDRAFLREGDKVQLGRTILKFVVHDAGERRYQQEIQRRIHHDELTGLLTARRFYERLDERLHHAHHEHKTLAVAMMDLDSLKSVNDSHGHLAGSFVIKSVGALLQRELGPLGDVGRYGGDEFVACLPGLTGDEALPTFSQLLGSLSAQAFTFGELTLRVTLSVGVATYPWDGLAVEEIVNAADKALLVAKRSGKNRIEVAPRD
jgi:two-component system cell cycle response regulator